MNDRAEAFFERWQDAHGNMDDEHGGFLAGYAAALAEVERWAEACQAKAATPVRPFPTPRASAARLRAKAAAIRTAVAYVREGRQP